MTTVSKFPFFPFLGVEVGTHWYMRMDCSRDGIHRPTVAGIHGGEDGCYSVALSGGYEDDLDLGECFTFTGEGKMINNLHEHSLIPVSLYFNT